MTGTQQDLQDIAFGQDVEAFIKGQLGQYLIKRAEDDRASALEELAKADPEDEKAIRAIQFRIQVVDGIQQYFADAISKGQALEHQLSSPD